MGKEKMSFSKKVKNGVKKAVSWINNFEQIAAELAIENEYGGPIKGRKIDQRLRDRILRELLKFDVFVECTAIDMSLHSIDAVFEHKEKRAHFIENTPSTQNPFLQKMRASFAEKIKKN